MTDLLTGKTILITGASAGIGAHAARLFAREGANLVLAARRLAQLDQVARSIREDGGDVLAVQADTTSADDIDRAITTAFDRWGGLHGALNNAGRSQGGGRLAEVPTDTFEAVLDVNFRGTWLAMRAEIAAMTSPGATGGSIVNISSIGGTFGTPGQSIYGATKAAVIAMSRSAATEYGRDNIRVNAIAPGATMTDMMTAWQEREPGIVDKLGSLAALGRVGQPDEIAEAAAWLISDRASYVTGMALGVDGGTAPWPH
ncbi:SDR family NAD(P)-dependent oxidoreductase [Allobranchiibius huperziae]|uniref:NAD(P)-dependent dehydrogenase (Short-subunit alcohol dehydrogenase family) n=1 Tax=Allobranchiibius huperziae TaxID=1874116 RepID=A0A853DKT7_9MICO|nr:SDR family NAD(P)-dependent oxidoreductase [Allobranchiibius huperziae]NYJ75604.1 NAD(P)-dependent dehydrogenase (short-subunit alcohol dehydrogenase family) [Allobranchiibius huperziae]